MPLRIPNTTVPDAYTDSQAKFAGTDVFEQGYIIVANNPVLVRYFVGALGQSRIQDEIFVAPSILSVRAGARQPVSGIQFRNATPGQTAQVLGVLYYPGEAIVQGTSAFDGTITPGGSFIPPGGGLSSLITYSTSFPATPSDGQLVAIVDNLAAPTYQFFMRWNQAAGQWISLGPGRSAVQNGGTGVINTFTAVGADFYDPNASFTIPAAWGIAAVSMRVTALTPFLRNAGAAGGVYSRIYVDAAATGAQIEQGIVATATGASVTDSLLVGAASGAQIRPAFNGSVPGTYRVNGQVVFYDLMTAP